MLTREAVWWFYAIALLGGLLKGRETTFEFHRSVSAHEDNRRLRILGTVVLLAVFVLHYALIIPKCYLNPSGEAAERNSIIKAWST